MKPVGAVTRCRRFSGPTARFDFSNTLHLTLSYTLYLTLPYTLPYLIPYLTLYLTLYLIPYLTLYLIYLIPYLIPYTFTLSHSTILLPPHVGPRRISPQQSKSAIISPSSLHPVGLYNKLSCTRPSGLGCRSSELPRPPR